MVYHLAEVSLNHNRPIGKENGVQIKPKILEHAAEFIKIKLLILKQFINLKLRPGNGVITIGINW